ncbi:MAG TPA: cation diffusion facilitator family transporter, partial [Treponemataceae bacterium]|nr:cation diffusion facilitator family transporter [Treponemataceae bacterium]
MQENNRQNRNSLVRKAAFIALFGNLVLAGLKLFAGIKMQSLAVIGDGIDSSTDVVIAILTLAVGFYINQPSDKKHPWGHRRAETIATLALAFIIMYAGVQLLLSAISQLRTGIYSELPKPTLLVVTGISIVGKIGLAINQHLIGKKAKSAIVLANAKNMANDIIISASVFVGIGLALLLRIPFLDPITALLVSLWVINSAIGIFKDQNLELMDGNADDEIYRSLFKAVTLTEGAANPHRARIRRMAGSWDIDLDIEVNGNLTVREAHDIAEKVESEIRCLIPDVYDVVIHVEPDGKGEHKEQFGLCE